MSRSDVAGADRRAARPGGAARVPLEPAFLFSKELLQIGDSGAADADRHQRPAVRASADPLAPGDVAQRFSRSGAHRREHRRAALPAVGGGSDAAGHDITDCSCAGSNAARCWCATTTRRCAARCARSSSRRGTIYLNQCAARRSGAAEIRPGHAHRPQGAARRRWHEVTRTPPAARWAAARRAARRRRAARAGCAARLARLRMQLLRRRAAVPEDPVPPLPGAQAVPHRSRRRGWN